MNSKTKKEVRKDEEKKRTLSIQGDDKSRSPGRTAAKVSLNGLINAPILMTELGGIKGCEPGIQDWMEELAETMKEVKDGNSKRIEGMLVGQIYALDALFINLSRKALNAQYVPQLETFTRLAMKAQNQSRATAQTLASIKNPQSTVFMKQANIANGPQQVNNNCNQKQESDGQETLQSSLKNFKTEQNELLNVHEEIDRLDTGATRPSSRDDQEMETLGKVNRPQNRVRQSNRSKKR